MKLRLSSRLNLIPLTKNPVCLVLTKLNFPAMKISIGMNMKVCPLGPPSTTAITRKRKLANLKSPHLMTRWLFNNLVTLFNYNNRKLQLMQTVITNIRDPEKALLRNSQRLWIPIKRKGKRNVIEVQGPQFKYNKFCTITDSNQVSIRLVTTSFSISKKIKIRIGFQ